MDDKKKSTKKNDTNISGWIIVCGHCETTQQAKNYIITSKTKITDLPLHMYHSCIKCGKVIYVEIDLHAVKSKVVESISV